MLIAFEGPDKAGKSTTANELASSGQSVYNMTTELHKMAQAAEEATLVQTFDRVDWLTHMVYRLAMPEHEWNDARVRTVFAMPDTHLIFKVHNEQTVQTIEDELYEGADRLVPVNNMYKKFAKHFMSLNESLDYRLFKTVGIVEVYHDAWNGSFKQRLTQFSSPAFGYWGSRFERLVDTNESLLELLRYEEHQRLVA